LDDLELPFSEHWNGTNWSAVTTPNPGADAQIDSLSGLTGGPVFAVRNTHLIARSGFTIRWLSNIRSCRDRTSRAITAPKCTMPGGAGRNRRYSTELSLKLFSIPRRRGEGKGIPRSVLGRSGSKSVALRDALGKKHLLAQRRTGALTTVRRLCYVTVSGMRTTFAASTTLNRRRCRQTCSSHSRFGGRTRPRDFVTNGRMFAPPARLSHVVSTLVDGKPVPSVHPRRRRRRACRDQLLVRRTR
jgi:hypothetical protein